MYDAQLCGLSAADRGRPYPRLVPAGPARPGQVTLGPVGILLAGLLVAGLAFAVHADEVEKLLFLVVEDNGVYASNTLTGRIDRLELHAKERIEDYKVANAVAVLITNQRYAAYGVLPGGWRSLRLRAQETTESVEVGDYSATVVTSDRILNFSGRRGAWSEVLRSVK